MKKYRNLSGNSGVAAYETGPGWIKVSFNSGTPYTYSYNKAGKHHVEQMISLAQNGRGLATYINRYVKDLYDK